MPDAPTPIQEAVAWLRAYAEKMTWHLLSYGDRNARWADAIEAQGREIERLLEAQFQPTGDNHHNAALCPYCNPTLQRQTTALKAARDLIAKDREEIADVAELSEFWGGGEWRKDRSVAEYDAVLTQIDEVMK